ncbi:DNA methyltransferase [Azospirillum sp. BE72]|uniref:DNA methyltransferase n=1 Tax=Azospirillum sp. BE72 TaxID=2817776 RepID=UPI00285E9C24|nr:DNA methyltransferase [Azospirillum sp. BE72]MDR6770765.1 16S rRNA G966 N2-methylase RsmD [Azospirillum sp. BE72]
MDGELPLVGGSGGAGRKEGPVQCLGRSFPSEEARRAWYRERLARHLAEPAFRAQPGFPKADDATILRLSDPPWFTACPNPFLEEFVAHFGRPYDPAEPYDVQPFADDVAEGKTDALYKAHNYHTKVPPKAIVPFILAYTKPGDIVLDGFCGSGMTGVAAGLCGTAPQAYRQEVEARFRRLGRPAPEWGARRAIMSDLSPAAAFIAANSTTPFDLETFAIRAKQILAEVEAELGWMYRTRHLHKGKPTEEFGRIEYTVWSQVFRCPTCTGEIVFTDVALDKVTGRVHEAFNCPHCTTRLTKAELDVQTTTEIDQATDESWTHVKFTPHLIVYSHRGRDHSKSPDEEDLAVLKRIAEMPLPPELPTDAFPIEEMSHGSRLAPKGVTHIHHLFLPRPRHVLAAMWRRASAETDGRLRNMLIYLVEQAIWGMSLLNRYSPTHYSQTNRILNGVYYVASQSSEVNFRYILDGKLKSIKSAFSHAGTLDGASTEVTTCSSLRAPTNSLDYIFTDPPFGENIYYADMNLMVETWHRAMTTVEQETIVDSGKEKTIDDYRDMMAACFAEYFRVLKPGRWITVVFHNSYNAVWNAIQEAMGRAGFVVASVLTLDKKQRSYRQETSHTVKNDLVINAYKPSPAMLSRFDRAKGSPDSVWTFIEEQLRHAPRFAELGSRLETAAERTPLRLFDRMVSFHLVQGAPIPLSRGEFLEELAQRYPLEDGMHFLDEDQLRAYRAERNARGVPAQAELFINDERSAILWLHHQLEHEPRTIDQLYNPYKAAAQTWPAKEQDLELRELLRFNFVEYKGDRPVPEKLMRLLRATRPAFLPLDPNDPETRSLALGHWYVPDPADQAEIERAREEHLWGEFQQYRGASRKRFSKARREAVRVGFSHLLGEGKAEEILAIAKRLPEETVQEDEQITILYDTARTLAGEL